MMGTGYQACIWRGLRQLDCWRLYSTRSIRAATASSMIATCAENCWPHLRLSTEARLGDLRDPELPKHRLSRSQVASSPAEHYPCTRRPAIAARVQSRSGRTLQGLIWHSRQAELGGHPPTEVMVLFGDLFPSGRGTWPLTGPGIRNLYEGAGRLLIDQIAEDLDALVEPEN